MTEGYIWTRVHRSEMEVGGKRVVDVGQGRDVSQLLQRVYEVDNCGSSVNVKCRGLVWDVDGIEKAVWRMEKMRKPRRAGLREKSQGARAGAQGPGTRDHGGRTGLEDNDQGPRGLEISGLGAGLRRGAWSWEPLEALPGSTN